MLCQSSHLQLVWRRKRPSLLQLALIAATFRSQCLTVQYSILPCSTMPPHRTPFSHLRLSVLRAKVYCRVGHKLVTGHTLWQSQRPAIVVNIHLGLLQLNSTGTWILVFLRASTFDYNQPDKTKDRVVTSFDGYDT